MDKIMNTATILHNQILNSKEYTDYQLAKEKLYKNKDLHKSVTDFRTLQITNRFDEINNIETDFSKEKHLSKLYSDLMISKTARNFFVTENAIIDIFDNINKILEKDIDIDLFDLE